MDEKKRQSVKNTAKRQGTGKGQKKGKKCEVCGGRRPRPAACGAARRCPAGGGAAPPAFGRKVFLQ